MLGQSHNNVIMTISPRIRRRTTRRGGNRCKDISACFESVSSLYLGLSSVIHHSIKNITLIIIFHIVATNSKICHQTIIKYHSSEESSSMPRDLRPWQSIIRDFSYFGYVYILLLNEPLGNIGLFIIFIFIQSLSWLPLYLYSISIFVLTASLSLSSVFFSLFINASRSQTLSESSRTLDAGCISYCSMIYICTLLIPSDFDQAFI